MSRKSSRNANAAATAASTTPIFDGLVFTLSNTVSADLAKTITNAGGSVAATLTKQVTHMIATDVDVTAKKPLAKLKNAFDRNDVKVVSEKFVNESVIKNTKLDETPYLLQLAPDASSSSAHGNVNDQGKGAANGAKRKRGKAKEEVEEEEEEEEEEAPAPKKGSVAAPEPVAKTVKVIKKGAAAVDALVPANIATAVHVYEQDGEVFDALLNQTDIKNNNNKFYIIQLLKYDSRNEYMVWTRWGRVGVDGQNAIQSFSNVDQAIKNFESKFKDKTKNNWADRANFVKVSGKYQLLERDWGDDAQADEEEDEEAPEANDEPVAMDIDRKDGAATFIVPLDADKFANEYDVLQKDGVIYDVLLNQTDIGNNNNKFYIIQLLKHKTDPNKFMVWTRWGRVGNAGTSAQPAFNSFDAALKEFKGKFKDKTKNEWENRENFVKVDGKYHLLERDFTVDTQSAPSAAEKKSKEAPPPEEKVESKLDKPIQELIALIYNMDLAAKEMSQLEYDANKMPLGKLTKRTIQQGYGTLKKIADELMKPVPSKANLTQLSSDFYSVIPHTFGMRRPTVIDTTDLLKVKIQMLEALADIEITTTLLKDIKKPTIDSKYEHLQCGMRVVDKTSDVFALVEKYTKNTHGSTHSYYTLDVEEVFELAKDDKFDDLGAKLHNRKLLWHGSRISNFVGILSQGLRIAPPEAPVTGYMFGKGVYFADMVSKSANYCFTSSGNNTGLLLLCEVALGETHPFVNADYNADTVVKSANKHSTWGMGRTIPDPSGYVTLENGVVVPCGKETQTGTQGLALQYNEFIVYDISQIRLK
ncbi:Poly [ADP-ribose] polymerase 2 [Blyttiomyces sp. JEL0837]|nr:Poly [ADP-ribose] polymerase 2 [Blyttiomyces sp. JEL0837]